MPAFQRVRVLVSMISIALFVAACGAPGQQDTAISTAVAQTVQAGEALTRIAIQPTLTPQPTLPAGTLTVASTPTNAPTLISAPPDPNCASASLIGENPPDG